MNARQATLRQDVTAASEDRLAVTVVIAIALHASVLLGVSFAPEPAPPARFQAMQVVLVAEKSAKAPREATALAPVNSEGGGESVDDLRPATPVIAPMPARVARIASTPPPEVRAERRPPIEQPEPAPERSGRPQAKERLTRVAPRGELPLPTKVETERTRERADAPPAPQLPPQEELQSEALPVGAQQLVHSFAIANLNAEIQERLESRAKRPRRKYVSANTREYKYAAYMEAWRAKVERVGNLNYPEEARRRGLGGNVMLDVAVNRDGSVAEISVRRSSGQPLLDDAAVRSVQLAAPFEPLTADIVQEVDVLHITRTWSWKPGTNAAMSVSH